MANAALELGQRDPEVRERVALHLNDIEAVFLGALESARVKGEIDESGDLEALARFLTMAAHGLGVMARGGAQPAALLDCVNVTLSALECVCVGTPVALTVGGPALDS